MSYTKHNFADGNVLTAAQLNEMDNQIYLNDCSAIVKLRNYDISAGQVCKINGSNSVITCSVGENFDGVCITEKDGNNKSFVKFKGIARVSYSGTAPTLGHSLLCADGAGGVKVVTTGGKDLLCIDKDTTNRWVEILL